MEAFRTLIRGWLGKVLLVLFLTPLALVGIEGYFSGSNEEVAIQVNDQEITKAELDNWIKSQKDQYLQGVGGDETLLNNEVIEAQVYDAAIVRALLIQQAEKLGLTLSDEQLGALLRQQQAFQQDGQFSQQLLDNYLANSRSTINQLLTNFRQQTALSLITQSLISTSLHSAKDTENLIKLISQERTTHLAEIPLANFAQDFVATDAAVKTYYDKNIASYNRAANVDVQYVVLNKSEFETRAEVSEQDLQQAYQAYSANLAKDASREISHIMIATGDDGHKDADASKLALTVQAELKAGAKFEDLVKKYSEDPVSKEANGKVDGYTVGAFGDAFDQAVLGLKQSGQTSAPVKTDFGYHIIRLDQLSGVDVPPLSSVRDELMTEAKEKKVENMYQDAIGHANETALETDSLEALAEQYKVSVQTARNVQANNTDVVLSDAQVKQKLFSEQIAEGDRNVSTGITTTAGSTVWFKVSEYRAERPQTLAEAKADIQAKLKRAEQVKQAEASVKQLLADFKTKPAKEALASSKLSFTNLGPVPRYSALLPNDLEKVAYSVPAPTKEGFWSAKSANSGEYLFVVAVSAIGQNPAFTLTDEQKVQVVNRFDPRGQNELNDYIEYLRSQAKVDHKSQKN
uniref:SurA N-terminal domain-containing protein n=1 Tax=uncultured Acinetobacter sp. TaxID=165433 RepID=UPI0026024577|nr:SurA N-terminal domain-containing protein [uncultured Acinetobacter sp.]